MMIILLVVFTLIQSSVCVNYRKDGNFILGAILPLSKANGVTKCGMVNPPGIAAAEAFIAALDRIKLDGEFSSLVSTRSIGYDIRDNCNDLDIERTIAYAMSSEAVKHRQDSAMPKPVGFVLGSFLLESNTTMSILNNENIPQISYVNNNAKLVTSNSNAIVLQKLVSAYPENIEKMSAVLDLIKQFKYKYVHVVVSNDYQGKAGLNLLSTGLDGSKVMHKDHIVSNNNDIDNVITSIKSNHLITVVVLHCSKDLENQFYTQAVSNNMTYLYVISTRNWNEDIVTIQPYASVLDGMMYVSSEQPVSLMSAYFNGNKVAIPFTDHQWIQPLFLTSGLNACLTSFSSLNATEQATCKLAETNTKSELAKLSSDVLNAYVSTYILAHALKGQTGSKSLLDVMKTLSSFTVGLLNHDVKISAELTVEASQFKIYSGIRNASEFKTLEHATWNKDTAPQLKINDPFRFKGMSGVVPVSTCAEPCQEGYKMLMNNDCWLCKKCPNGSVSTSVNSDKCIKCALNEVANPSQTQCVAYRLDTFDFDAPMGAFILFLIVISLCILIVGFALLIKFRDHELVTMTGFTLLCFYALGVFLLIICTIPLLVEPTTHSCSFYIALFNLGLTLCFAVLMSRSALINGYYNKSGGLESTSCGPSPRSLMFVIVVGIQVLIMLIGLLVDEPETQHNDTKEWNVRYFECSSWASYIFWIGFGYNIALSVIGNFLSCTSTKMEEGYEELKWILITYCLFYLIALFEVVIFYRYVDIELSEAQAIMCIIFALLFFFTFFWPKIYAILFHSKSDGKTLEPPEHHKEQQSHHTAHGSDGFKHHGIIQLRLKEGEEAAENA